MSQPSDRVDRRVWVIAAACSCGPLMSGLDSTMVNVSLDTLGSAFNVSLGTIQWVTTGYLLALALSLPLSGWRWSTGSARGGSFSDALAGRQKKTSPWQSSKRQWQRPPPPPPPPRQAGARARQAGAGVSRHIQYIHTHAERE